MAFAKYYRWSDGDRRLGPFIFARNTADYRPIAIVLSSGRGDDPEFSSGCVLRVSASGRTLIMALPPVIRPWKRWVDCSKYEWSTSNEKGYWDRHPREYGFSLCRGFANGGSTFLQVFLGAQTHDSATTQDWCTTLPWTAWRHVRRSLYGLDGAHHWTEPESLGYGSGAHDVRKAAEDSCPSQVFCFKDYDGEGLTATTRIEEREWRFGTGWFKWLSLFRKPIIRRSLDIRFSGETGRRKGSWKGGTIGSDIEMLPNEFHEAAFRRYCAEHQMVFDRSHDTASPAVSMNQSRTEDSNASG